MNVSSFNWYKIYPLYSIRISCVKDFNHQVMAEKYSMDQVHMNELFWVVTIAAIIAFIIICLWLYSIFEACTRVEARSDDISQDPVLANQGMFKTFP